MRISQTNVATLAAALTAAGPMALARLMDAAGDAAKCGREMTVNLSDLETACALCEARLLTDEMFFLQCRAA